LAKPVTARGLYNRIASVIENPRRFVRASEYFGPDRRRSVNDFMGSDKRDDEE
jgi:hypothetical protein